MSSEASAYGRSPLPLLALAALGVVYGDIGTSPLYALRECFHGSHAVSPTPENVLGVLSLVFWALIVLGIVALGKWLFSSPGQVDSGKRALEILQERYARGEINRDQYERMRQDLLA